MNQPLHARSPAGRPRHGADLLERLLSRGELTGGCPTEGTHWASGDGVRRQERGDGG